MKGEDGFYHIHGQKFELLKGSRAQVMHGTAYKTEGNLTKNKLMMNKHGRIVSEKKHHTAKNEKRLLKHGYGTQKGAFGFVKTDGTMKRQHKHKRRSHHKRSHHYKKH